MKISLGNWCPLCEKARLSRLEPTLWECVKCEVLFELTTFFYGKEEDEMVLKYEFVIKDTRVSKDDRDERYDGKTPL